jgi:hypothetical protein
MQPIKIAIPEPCHENWGNMNPTQQGRFCNSCAKEVIDFSVMDDGEMYMTLQKAMQNNKSVCGRVQTNQLQRPILSTTQKIKTQVAWYWKYVTALFLFSNEAKTFAQKKPATVCTSTNITLGKMISTQQVQHVKGDTVITTTQNLNTIKGTVSDENGEPIIAASVLIKGTKSGCTTNEFGEFELKATKEKDVLIISYVGYDSKEFTLKNYRNYDFALNKSTLVDGEIVVIAGGMSISDYKTPTAHNVIGNVIDSTTKLVIQNATITIKELNSNKKTSNFSDKKGNFTLNKLYDYNNYEVTISAPGFTTKKVTIKGTDFKKKKLKYVVQLVREVDIRNYLFGEIYPKQRIKSKGLPLGDVVLMGKVINEQGNPISNANISIKGKYEHFTSDSLGNFNVKTRSKNDILQISYLGKIKEFNLSTHTGTEFVLDTKKEEKEVIVTASYITGRISKTQTMGGVSIIKQDTLLDKFKGLFINSKKQEIVQPNKITNLKIYPNPSPILSLTYVDIINEDAYAIHIINESGIVLQKELVNTNAKNKKMAVRLSNAVIAGFYIVELTNSKGKIISNGKLIVQ